MFDLESPFWRFIRRLSDAFIIGLLWIITCIPVFTIGPSTCALYKSLEDVVLKEEKSPISSYFKSFKRYFKKGVICWIIMLILLMIFVGDIYFTVNFIPEESPFRYMMAPFMALFCLCIMVGFFLVHTIIRQEGSVDKIGAIWLLSIKKAFVYLPRAFGLFAISAGLLFVTYYCIVRGIVVVIPLIPAGFGLSARGIIP